MVSISANQTVAVNAQKHSLEKKRKSAIKDAFFFEYIDMLDIYLPDVALSSVLFYFQLPNPSEEAATILLRSSLLPYCWAALWVRYYSVWWRINVTGAMPLAIECTQKKRSFISGFIIADFPVAYVSINLIMMLMFAFFLSMVSTLFMCNGG